MLSRARKLQNMILVGYTAQVEDLLRRGPPSSLIKIVERLEQKAEVTMSALSDWPVYDSLRRSAGI